MTGSVTSKGIVTSSIEEGLDFACSMLVDALQAASGGNANDAPGILSSLAQYVRFRYVGELRLAFEELSGLAADIRSHLHETEPFDDQMRWLQESLGKDSPDTSLASPLGGT